MNKKAKFLFFCMIIVAGEAFSQKVAIINAINPATEKKYQWILTSNNQQKITKQVMLKPGCNNPGTTKVSYLSSFNSYLVVNKVSGSISVIHPDFYSKNLGFFCKKEIQIEKTTKIPFKFRLGSVQQCDWLEGKRY